MDDPDPVKPLIGELAQTLREQFKNRSEELANAQRTAVQQLESWDEWRKLDSTQRESILAEAKLILQPAADVSTDTELLEALDNTPLSGWQDRIGLVPSRREQARQFAAKQLAPGAISVTPPPATLKTREELDAYLADLREQILRYIEENKTVIL